MFVVFFFLRVNTFHINSRLSTYRTCKNNCNSFYKIGQSCSRDNYMSVNTL